MTNKYDTIIPDFTMVAFSFVVSICLFVNKMDLFNGLILIFLNNIFICLYIISRVLNKNEI